MIKNLTHEITREGVVFHFIIETEIGEVTCKVYTHERDNHNRPKAYGFDYKILGVAYKSHVYNEHSHATLIMNIGLIKLGKEFCKVCENNGWCAWSY